MGLLCHLPAASHSLRLLILGVSVDCFLELPHRSNRSETPQLGDVGSCTPLWDVIISALDPMEQLPGIGKLGPRGERVALKRDGRICIVSGVRQAFRCASGPSFADDPPPVPARGDPSGGPDTHQTSADGRRGPPSR